MSNECCPSVRFEDFVDFLGLPQWVTHGAMFSTECQECEDICPWPAPHRENLSRSIRRAISTIEQTTGNDICPSQKSVICDPNDCPIYLPPGAVIGKRELVAIYELDICYTWRSGCSDYVPEADRCPDMDLIGQVNIPIPDGWEYDERNIEIGYGRDVRRTDQCLAKPEYGWDCCQIESADSDHPCPPDCGCYEICEFSSSELVETIVDTNDCSYPAEEVSQQVIITVDDTCGIDFAIGSRVLVGSTNLSPFFGVVTAVSVGTTDFTVTIAPETAVDSETFEHYTWVAEPHIVATWDKWLLVHPNVSHAHVYKPGCNDREKGFIKKVVVKFYNMDQSESIQPIETCTCDSCKLCSCSIDSKTSIPMYDYNFVEETGQLCFARHSNGCVCSICEAPHKVKVNYWLWPCVEDSMLAAVSLRALIWTPPVKCSCGIYDKLIEYWLENDPGAMSEAFTNPNHYPYGKTRAGAELARLLTGDRLEKERKNKAQRSSGLLSRKRLNKRVF